MDPTPPIKLLDQMRNALRDEEPRRKRTGYRNRFAREALPHIASQRSSPQGDGEFTLTRLNIMPIAPKHPMYNGFDATLGNKDRLTA
jgi:hypothetical protein